MSAERRLTLIADAIDQAMRQIAIGQIWSPWENVEWLRLRADLLDRLAGVAGADSDALARRAELVRDRAERLADQLNRVPQQGPAGPLPRTDQDGAGRDRVGRDGAGQDGTGPGADLTLIEQWNRASDQACE
ncbi:hypothetical protein [Goodfellowiella coeruleoviolacea]|uniref:Uncharacterized protein n=1 Tax=Goodfellowiella coeruleoviolacea TaxID=334858 RepID=A0AAE3KII4_9PSEU|nr:hypothetical protein [Goodfellowiella coeruleoviolacea]MCP2169296.1 hypothetical protein [Goodfellowiella coeruleoviolacea]